MDNTLFITEFPESEAKYWLLTSQLVRQADRYSERTASIQHPDGYGFQRFRFESMEAMQGRDVTNSPHSELFQYLKQRWERERLRTEDILPWWDAYLTALETYKPGTIIPDIAEYERMLQGLGSFFHILPEAPRNLSPQVTSRGMLDQHFNNLRDLKEDLEQGINYIPLSLLQEFRIKPEEMPKLVIAPDRKFTELMRYLLTSFVTYIKSKPELMPSSDQSHSNEYTSSWRNFFIPHNSKRYNRGTHILVASGYNYEIFEEEYRKCVDQEITPEQRAKFLHLTTSKV